MLIHLIHVLQLTGNDNHCWDVACTCWGIESTKGCGYIVMQAGIVHALCMQDRIFTLCWHCKSSCSAECVCGIRGCNSVNSRSIARTAARHYLVSWKQSSLLLSRTRCKLLNVNIHQVSSGYVYKLNVNASCLRSTDRRSPRELNAQCCNQRKGYQSSEPWL
jgi:ribosomal protein L28